MDKKTGTRNWKMLTPMNLYDAKPYDPDKKCDHPKCEKTRYLYRRWCAEHLEDVRKGRMTKDFIAGGSHGDNDSMGG